MPARVKPTTVVKFTPTQLAELERRLEELTDRLHLEDCGRHGDYCAALLPEVYGEPRKLPDTPTSAWAGSKKKIEVLAARRSAGFVLYHPHDVRNSLTAQIEAGTPDAPRRQAAKTHHGERPLRVRKPRPRKGKKVTEISMKQSSLW